MTGAGTGAVGEVTGGLDGGSAGLETTCETVSGPEGISLQAAKNVPANIKANTASVVVLTRIARGDRCECVPNRIESSGFTMTRRYGL